MKSFAIRLLLAGVTVFVFGVCHATLGATEEMSQSNAHIELSASLWGALGVRSLVDSDANFQNQIMAIPERLASLEFRPELKFISNQDSAPESSLVLRPRFLANATQAKVNARYEDMDANSRLQWSDAYLTSSLSENLLLVYGLQNYQWGPAEAASPSNRIFRDVITTKDVLYLVKGKHLLRINLSPSQQWTEVLLVELGDNGDREPESREEFSRKLILKSEWAWAGGANYFGVVQGWRDRFGWYWGEYLNVEAFEGTSLYFDANHQQGSLAWYPHRELLSGAIALSQSERDSKQIYSFVVTGLKYAFENGNEFHLEYIFHELGYTGTQGAQVWEALTPVTISQAASSKLNANELRNPGLDFYGRQYGLASYRVAEFLGKKDWTLYFRELISIQDGSLSCYASSERGFGASGTGFLSVVATQGKQDSELRGFVASAVVAGYRHTW